MKPFVIKVVLLYNGQINKRRKAGKWIEKRTKIKSKKKNLTL